MSPGPVNNSVAGSVSGPAKEAGKPLRAPWYSDFLWHDGRLEIRKTDIRLKVDHHLITEIASWIIWLGILFTAAALSRASRKNVVRLAFVPERPRPWYLIGGATLWAGMEQAGGQSDADAVVYFDDITTGEPPVSLHERRLNFACNDISKSHVAQVFEEIFGYPLQVDPELAQGQIVAKPEKNGVHGGRIIETPAAAEEGWCYQRLIDTCGADGYCRDLRTPCVDGRPVVVWVKLKSGDDRFSIHNHRALLRDPAEVYSAAELELIGAFTARMGLDWGGLDILRDADGRLYIVDVNKTDVGPVIALSWRDKILSMNRLSRALKQMVTVC